MRLTVKRTDISINFTYTLTISKGFGFGAFTDSDGWCALKMAMQDILYNTTLHTATGVLLRKMGALATWPVSSFIYQTQIYIKLHAFLMVIFCMKRI